MTTLEKKVDALCRMSLAPDDSTFQSAVDELRVLMAEQQIGQLISSSPMMDHIKNTLTDLGVPYGIVGRKYLEDAIKLAIDKPALIQGITKTAGLYDTVAQKNDTTPDRLSRAIRHGIELAWTRGDPDIHQQIFGGTIDPDKGKPTNREFIATVAQYIQRGC